MALDCFGIVFQKCVGSAKGTTTRLGLPDTEITCGCNPDEYLLPVFAEETTKTNENWNDISSFAFESGLDDDVVVYELEQFCGSWESKEIITNNNLGVWNEKGFNPAMPNMSTFTVEWFNVLRDYGVGKYRIKTEINGSDSFYSHVFNLRIYNSNLINGTVRFDWEMQGKWGADNGTELFDFGSESVSDSIRVHGSFGYKKNEYEKTEVQYQTGVIKRTREEAIKNYLFESGVLPFTVHNIISDFAVLSDTLKVTDFNEINSEAPFVELPIAINSGYDPTYYSGLKKAKVEVSFRLRTQNNYRKLC